MWLSPSRGAHSFETVARVSRVPITNVPEMVLWTESGLCWCNNYVDLLCLKSYEWRSGNIQDRQDATVRLIRALES
eukprot:4624701-Pyramimonas_sp.AAC.1